MKKPITTIALFFIASLCFVQGVFAQKHFQVTLKIDTSIVLKNLRYTVYDGQRIIFLKDSTGSRTIVFKGDYRSILAGLDISYSDKAGTFYFGSFFIGEKPAEIDLYYKQNFDQRLLNSRMLNARDVNDTLTNNVYREMVAFNKEYNMASWHFYEKNHDQFNTNPALYKEYLQLIQEGDIRTMEFLKKYPADYYSFWYFQHQIGRRVRELNPDTIYLNQLYTYFNTTFPPKFKDSYEGKDLAQAFEKALHPLKTSDIAPAFTVTTVDGKALSLKSLKGKIVLLDFWATWCGPCMKEIPFIKSLRNKYPANKLAIIGISRDTDLGKLKNAIITEGMNWQHFFDKKTDISRLYGVDVFPTLILLGKKGEIIYRSDYDKPDTEELPKVLAKAIE